MKILITAGPTREYFDSVRFISNPSSGKMGYALAAAAARRGHAVTLVSGPVALPAPRDVHVIQVTSAAEMAREVKTLWPTQDAAIMTAAVSDYRPAHRLDQKIAKSEGPLQVTLEATEDIARSCGASKRAGQILIAFAMEDHDARPHAEAKIRRKNCDAIVLNGPANIGTDTASVEVLVAGEPWSMWPLGTKSEVAERIIELAERLHSRVAHRT